MAENKKPSGEEKRIHERVAVDLSVTFQSEDEFASSYMSNISRGGVFIRTEEALNIDTVVKFKFTLPGDERVFKVLGMVVWSAPAGGKGIPGMGIQFTEMSNEDRILIEGFVEARLAETE